MDRLQKKCIIASSTFHGLLIAILIFGAALMPGPDETNFKPLTVYSSKDVSDAMTGGGPLAQAPALTPAQPPAAPPTPPAQPPAEQPPSPKPVEQPKPKAVEPAKLPPVEPPKLRRRVVPRAEIEPPKTNERVERTKPEPVTRTPRKIEIPKDSLKLATRKASDKSQAAEEAAQSEAREARRQAARQFASSLKNISQNISSATLVQSPAGDGTSSEMTVNYRDLIASKYYNAWSAPADLDDATTPVVIVSVTIARNGDVINYHVIKSSGNAAMDRSIQNVLQTVTFIEPFPASSRDQERTVTIRFNLQAKRATG